MTNPRYSVLIPSRNRLELLQLAVESVTAQDRNDVEIVISDNASDQDYESYLNAIQRHNIVSSRSNAPISVTDNWNRALSLATGDYIIMLGDDDALTPGFFDRMDNWLRQFEEPDCVYVMAYNYAYPDAVPHRPDGYFCTVNNSPLFDADSRPYVLARDNAKQVVFDALQFHHSVSFNAQHFVWKRSFVDRSGQPFFQSPYPDYFACNITFATANSIIVVPTPQIIVGLSNQSFGFHFYRAQDEGFAKFHAPEIDVEGISDGNVDIAAALRFPGSRHYRNWLCAAIQTQRALSGVIDLPVNFGRYRQIQISEIAFRAGFSKNISAKELNQISRNLNESERRKLFTKTLMMRWLRQTGAMTAGEVTSRIGLALNIHAPATILEHDIGRHETIMDAFTWLTERSNDKGSLPSSAMRALSPQELHIEKLTRAVVERDKEIARLSGLKKVEELNDAVDARDKETARLNNTKKKIREWRPVLSFHKTRGHGAWLHSAAAALRRLIGRAKDARLIVFSGLFDSQAYLNNNPDVAAARLHPVSHFLRHGWKEGRNPNSFFDTQWYLAKYEDVKTAGVNPLVHFIKFGVREGRDPSPHFSTIGYLERYPDVEAAGINPLRHFLKYGQSEGRVPVPSTIETPILPPSPDQDGRLQRMANLYARSGDLTAATLLELQLTESGRLQAFFDPYKPLNLVIDHRLNPTPRLRILVPSIKKRHATGGPNTAYILGAFLAQRGARVTFVATDIAPDDDFGPIKNHIKLLSGVDPEIYGIEFEDASDRSRPYAIGINDMFLATAWWTAHAAASAMRLTRARNFYYLVQDYETLFYSASEKYAQAECSYQLPFIPIVNTNLLLDHLVEKRVGQFANPGFKNTALVFDPAVDDTKFYPEKRLERQTRRLLFYARPTIAERNLFGLGVAALKAAVKGGHFGETGWEFLGMGEEFEPVDLGRGFILKPAPWHDLDAYAQQMRGADLLLSLMLSPHPSYPPLEMAACGGVTVTTTFGSKTAERLKLLSNNIIGVPPRIEDLVDGLSVALARSRIISNHGSREDLSNVSSWQDSLSNITAAMIEQLSPMGCVKNIESVNLPTPKTYVKTQDVEGNPKFYYDRLREREKLYREGSTSNILSLITTVYDTDADFLYDLAHTIFGQDTEMQFEWLILDNGSSNSHTLEALRNIGRHPFVRLHRVEVNIGIVGGMRWCLENARNKYIVPIDSDDLLFPDCLRTVSAFLEQTGFPPLVYTNEDKTDGNNPVDAYVKPAWDPVLFIHSCYVAHLTVIDRYKANELGCYTDPEAEGCHDWDTFARFMTAGIAPLHLPEILYTWRMHPGSTSANYKSKTFIYGSHLFVLNRFLAGYDGPNSLSVSLSPLFNGTPDYRFSAITSDLDEAANNLKISRDGSTPESVVTNRIATIRLSPTTTPAEVCSELRSFPDDVSMIHLLAADCDLPNDEWRSEAKAMFYLFPDCAIVGGRIHNTSTISEAGFVFGYDKGIGCPDAGRAINDPGYFGQMWKPRSVAAVSCRHCVIERQFLNQCLAAMPNDIRIPLLGPWLGALAAKHGRRVIYTPFVEAVSSENICLSEADAQRFNETFGDLSNNLVGYAEHLDRSGIAPYQTELTRRAPVLSSYDEYRYRLETTRKTNAAVEGQSSSITIITTVYKNTDAALFLETVSSVREQTLPPKEWLVLAHGPISNELLVELESLADEGLVRLLQTGTNLGIHGGLRYCLERAVGDYILSLDADDLLTPNAVEMLTQAIVDAPDETIFYSDEDHLIDGELRHPYYRPDFDPALLFSHSYIWHAILFKRSTALQLGTYTRQDAEFAVDWDTLVRFYLAGHIPRHVREVLYHWRQHRSSLSNSGTTFEGSLKSIMGVLNSIADAKNMNSRLEVAQYPVNVGAPDYYLKRLPIDPPAIDLVFLGRSEANSETVTPDFSFRSTTSVELLRGYEGIQAVRDALGHGNSDFVMLCGSALSKIEEHGLWQAMKHLELIDSCAAVGGCLIDFAGTVVSGAPVFVNDKILVDPLAGVNFNNAGHFSLALKPHSVDALSPDLLIGRRAFIEDALRSCPAELGMRSFGIWLSFVAAQKSMTLTYEPLLRGFIQNERALVGDPIEGLIRAVSKCGAVSDSTGSLRLSGYSSFSKHFDLHR